MVGRGLRETRGDVGPTGLTARLAHQLQSRSLVGRRGAVPNRAYELLHTRQSDENAGRATGEHARDMVLGHPQGKAAAKRQELDCRLELLGIRSHSTSARITCGEPDAWADGVDGGVRSPSGPVL